MASNFLIEYPNELSPIEREWKRDRWNHNKWLLNPGMEDIRFAIGILQVGKYLSNMKLFHKYPSAKWQDRMRPYERIVQMAIRQGHILRPTIEVVMVKS